MNTGPFGTDDFLWAEPARDGDYLLKIGVPTHCYREQAHSHRVLGRT